MWEGGKIITLYTFINSCYKIITLKLCSYVINCRSGLCASPAAPWLCSAWWSEWPGNRCWIYLLPSLQCFKEFSSIGRDSSIRSSPFPAPWLCPCWKGSLSLNELLLVLLPSFAESDEQSWACSGIVEQLHSFVHRLTLGVCINMAKWVGRKDGGFCFELYLPAQGSRWFWFILLCVFECWIVLGSRVSSWGHCLKSIFDLSDGSDLNSVGRWGIWGVWVGEKCSYWRKELLSDTKWGFHIDSAVAIQVWNTHCFISKS